MLKDIFSIRCNTNTLLFDIVDSISKWSPYTFRGTAEYFNHNFKRDEQANKYILEYAKIREKFDWEAESELFEWAFNGFKNHDKFGDLKPLIDNISNSKNISTGLTLREYLEKKSPLVERVAKSVLEELNAVSLEVLTKLSSFFPITQKEKIYLYLGYSFFPTSMQGSANGNDIKVSFNENETSLDNIKKTILHEYTHKYFNWKKYIKNLSPEMLQPCPFANSSNYVVMEEILNYTVSDLVIAWEGEKGFSKDLAREVLYSGKEYSIKSSFSYLFVKPRIEALINGKIGIKAFSGQLVEKYFKYIKRWNPQR